MHRVQVVLVFGQRVAECIQSVVGFRDHDDLKLSTGVWMGLQLLDQLFELGQSIVDQHQLVAHAKKSGSVRVGLRGRRVPSIICRLGGDVLIEQVKQSQSIFSSPYVARHFGGRRLFARRRVRRGIVRNGSDRLG